MATLLVQNGTLHIGDVLIAGTTVGRVRAMTNYRGQSVKEAGPCVPVEITGLDEVPTAGDDFAVVENERLARELAEQRKHEQKEEQFKQYQKVTLDNLFSQIAEGEMKELPPHHQSGRQRFGRSDPSVDGKTLQRRSARARHPWGRWCCQPFGRHAGADFGRHHHRL